MTTRLRSCFVMTCVAASTVMADTLTWDTAAGDAAAITEGAGTWSDGGAKWNNAGADDVWDNATPDNAIFGGGTSASGAAGPVTLGSDITAGKITFNVPKAGNYTNNTSIYYLTLTNGIAAVASATIQSGAGGAVILGNNNTWTVWANKNLTVSAVVDDGAGTCSLTKNGLGALTLSGANAYKGVTAVEAGSLLLYANATTLGTTAAGTVVSNGAQLRMMVGMTLDEDLTLSGIGVGTAGAAYGALSAWYNGGTFTLNGAITLNGAAAINTYAAGACTFNITQGIGGTGDLTLRSGGANSGNHTYVLKGQSSYTGDTILDTAAVLSHTVQCGTNNALPETTVLKLQATASTKDTVCKFKLNGFNQQVAGIEGSSGVTGANTYSNSIVGGSATLSVLTVSNRADRVFAGRLGYTGANENNLALVKKGPGTQALASVNTYSGSTTINDGTLAGVTGGSCANSAVTVAATSGGTALLGVAVTDTAKQWTCPSVTINNGGTASGLGFDFGALTPGTSLAPLNVSGGVTFTTAPIVAVRGTSLLVTTGNGYPLAAWGSGPAPSLAGATLLLPPHAAGTLSIVGNTLYLQIASNTYGQPLKWTGGDGTWDINNSGNAVWQDSSLTATNYVETALGNDAVVFDNEVGSGGTVTLDIAVSPLSVTVSNTVADYTFSGSGGIAGGAALTKQGAGTLILNTTNTYTGVTMVKDGTLQLGSGDVSGSISNSASIDLSSATSRLVVNRSANFAIDQVISGAGSLMKTNAGQLSLTAANSYSGVTTVAGGEIWLSNDSALGSSAAGTVVKDGAAVRINNVNMTLAEPLTLTGSGVGAMPSTYGALVMFRNSGQWVLNGVVTLANGAALETYNSGLANVTLAQGIGGTGDLTLSAGAALNGGSLYILKGQSSYTGETVLKTINVSQGITLRNDIANALPPTTVLRMQAGNSVYANAATAKFTLNGFNQEVAGLEAAGMNVLSAASTNSIVGGSMTQSVLTVNNSADFTYGGRLGDAGPNENNLSLVKKGPGVLTLTFANTYSGPTVVSNGVLRVTHVQAFPATADVYVEPGAMIDLDFTGVNTIRRLYVNGQLMTVNVAYGAARQPASLSGPGYLLATEGSGPTGTIINVR